MFKQLSLCAALVTLATAGSSLAQVREKPDDRSMPPVIEGPRERATEGPALDYAVVFGEPAHEHQGMHGRGHVQLHHWYRTLRQPATGYACCDNKDCRPTTVRLREGTIEVLVDGEWTTVPHNTILNKTSPDLNSHVCAPKGPWSPKPIFCVVLGFGA